MGLEIILTNGYFSNMGEDYKYHISNERYEVIETFNRLAQRYPADYIPSAREHLATALGHLRSLDKDTHGPILLLAEQLAASAEYLLDHYGEYNAEQQALIMGAVRYFILHTDSTPDSTPVIGLNDDVKVMNFVLERLGITDHFID